MKYRGVKLLKTEGHSIKKCCELLKISYSGFYDWQRRRPSKRKKRDGELKAKVLSIFGNAKGRYGSPRVHRALQNEGEKVSENKVARLMQEEGLRARGKKSFRPKTTINNPSDKKSARIYKIEDHRVEAENEVWVSDLTYIPTKEGFCYLTTVMDLYNREIKGMDLSGTMEAVNTKNSFMNAVKLAPGSLRGLIFHSDQGVQYCSSEVRKKLKILKVTQSMSRKGNCYDNAFAESFFHTLKNELEKKVFKDMAEAKKEIFEYIYWYNTERLHSSLRYLSPVDYVNRETRDVA